MRVLCQSGVELWWRFVRPTAGPLSFGESRASIPTRMLQPVRSVTPAVSVCDIGSRPTRARYDPHGPWLVTPAMRLSLGSPTGPLHRLDRVDLSRSLLLRNLPDRGPRRPVRLGGSPASRLILNRGISSTRFVRLDIAIFPWLAGPSRPTTSPRTASVSPLAGSRPWPIPPLGLRHEPMSRYLEGRLPARMSDSEISFTIYLAAARSRAWRR